MGKLRGEDEGTDFRNGESKRGWVGIGSPENKVKNQRLEVSLIIGRARKFLPP
jgi:hypothetical protein